jgi:adhesin transport system membrane fusion protein
MSDLHTQPAPEVALDLPAPQGQAPVGTQQAQHDTWRFMLAQFDGSLGQHRRMRLPRLLVGAVALLVCGAVLWALLANVDKVVRVTGRIVPSLKPQIVQHLEGGIVSQVLVREGDSVHAGDKLLEISDLVGSSQQGEKTERRDGLRAKVARLTAEAQGDAQFSPPPGMGSQDQAFRNEWEAFTARQTRKRQSELVLAAQVTQKQQEAAELEARRKGLLAEAEVANQQLTLVKNMISRNAASKLELLEAQARVERLQTQIQESQSSIPRLQAAAAELQARSGESRAQFRSDARSALSEAALELRRVGEEMRSDNDRVSRSAVKAPMDGTVNKLLINTVGGVIRPGETLLEITPQDALVLMEARVPPFERGPLQVGQRAVVRVAAFDYTVFGSLEARITEISSDSLVDERGERYFRVVLRVDAAQVRAFKQPLLPGSSITADLVVGRRTVAQYLLSPLRGLSSTAFRDRQ